MTPLLTDDEMPALPEPHDRDGGPDQSRQVGALLHRRADARPRSRSRGPRAREDGRGVDRAALAAREGEAVNYDPSDPDKMRLPADKTCGDCVHIRRCKLMFGHVETDRHCDWSPSRFRAATEPAALAAREK